MHLNWLGLQKLLQGKLSLKSLGGPITILESAGNALNSGWIAFISFLAFVSIAIGFVNLLPIPGLDGGHLLFYMIELIIRRPIPIAIQMLCFRIGFALLFIIIIQAIMNDLLRLY